MSSHSTKSFRDIVAGERAWLPQGAKFVAELVDSVVEDGEEGQGKQCSTPLLKSMLVQNEALDEAISEEELKLSKSTIFLRPWIPIGSQLESIWMNGLKMCGNGNEGFIFIIVAWFKKIYLLFFSITLNLNKK